MFVALYCATVSAVGAAPCVSSPAVLTGPHFRVTGRVIDDLTGAPIAGATVQLSMLCPVVDQTVDADLRAKANEAASMTDQDGHFAFDSVAATGVGIMASKDAYEPAWASSRRADDPIGFYVVRANMEPIILRLAPRPSISGTVRNERGEPLGGAWVTLWCSYNWAGWRGRRYCNSVQAAPDGS